jgi:hypothetical protein
MEKPVSSTFIEHMQRIYEDIGSLKASVKRLEKERKEEQTILYMRFPKTEC